MKVRIQNTDGNGYTTRITNAETGEPLDNALQVFKIDVERISIDVNQPVKAILHTYAPIIDVIADAEIKQICPYCGREKEQSE